MKRKGWRVIKIIPNCFKETKNILNGLPSQIDDWVISFNKRFINEWLYAIEFKDSLCLGHGLKWEGRSQIQIYLFKNETW